MNSFRLDKYNSTLKKCIAEIFLYEIRNPILKNISVVDVVTSRDLKSSRIYVSSNYVKKQVLIELSKTTGFIKKNLGKKMFLKNIPKIEFIYGREITEQENHLDGRNET